MTPVIDVYKNFLSKIADYDFLRKGRTDEEIIADLFGFLKSARAKFYKCKKNLNINEEDEFFKDELTLFEIEILTNLMLVEYLKPKVLAGEVIRPALSDKDFEIYSQANHLRELNLLYRLFRTESGKMITEYTYLSLGDGMK